MAAGWVSGPGVSWEETESYLGPSRDQAAHFIMHLTRGRLVEVGAGRGGDAVTPCECARERGRRRGRC